MGLLIDNEQKYLLLLLCDILAFPRALIFETSEPTRIPCALTVHSWDVPARGEPAMSLKVPASHPALPILLSLPLWEPRTHPAHLFLVPPSTHRVPWAPVSPAWLCMSAPQLLPILTSLKMDCRPVFFFFSPEGDPAGGSEEKAERQESDQVGGALPAVTLDRPTPGSFRDGPWDRLGGLTNMVPTLLGKATCLSPLADFSSLLIYTLLTRHLPCPERISSGHFPQC